MAKTMKCVTPKGELRWVNITGEGKENMSGKLQYVASVVCDPKEPTTEAFIAKIKDFWEENKPAGRKVPKSNGMYFANPLKGDDGEVLKDDADKTVYDENGPVMFAFHTGTTFPDGSVKKVKTFNAKAKEVSLGDIRIGNGSIGYISGAMGIYENKDSKGKILDAGVTLYLDSIQIVKLVEFTQESGFEADDSEEEGWTGDEGWTGEVDEAKAATAGPRL